MLRTALVIALTAASDLNSVASAQQPMCTERNQAINQLFNQFSEAPVAKGAAKSGAVLEILFLMYCKELDNLPDDANRCHLYDYHWRELRSFAVNNKTQPARLTPRRPSKIKIAIPVNQPMELTPIAYNAARIVIAYRFQRPSVLPGRPF
jgi:hypothetical protein